MNLLIIGGSGFLSGHVTHAALAAGHAVTIVTRGKRPAPAGVTTLVADRQDRQGFAKAIASTKARWDMAIDCIGFTAADAEQDVGVIGDHCDQLVFVSTDFVYSIENRPFPVDETFAGYEKQIAYGRGKREAELVILSAAGKLPVTVLRPCHIYGPGSLLGCLPMHGRDPKLIERLRAGETLTLVGGGHFLQQPIYAPDLASMLLSCHANPKAAGEVFLAAGPDVVESKRYYQIIAQHLGVNVGFAETSVSEFLAANPDKRPFCAHRVYSMQKARAAGLTVPATPLVEGLGQQVKSILG
jgi:nucleoside-diphosphate-sugar epimerase